MNAAEWSVDVDFLGLAAIVLFHADAAGGQP
jgi:hypothetical protein